MFTTGCDTGTDRKPTRGYLGTVTAGTNAQQFVEDAKDAVDVLIAFLTRDEAAE